MHSPVSGLPAAESVGSFPDGFRWGVSLSAHQTEGGNLNDWSQWEQAQAPRLARAAAARYARKSPAWPQIAAQAVSPENYRSVRAVEHYQRYAADFDLAAALHVNSLRISLEWSRLVPAEGVLDEAAAAHYRDVLAALRQRRLEPFVTLWHWPLPLWVSRRGGWFASRTIDDFLWYVQRAGELFSGQVRYWVTINEPMVYVYHAYLTGAWPPQKKNVLYAERVLQHLLQAHRRAYACLKNISAAHQIAIAKNNIHFEAKNNHPVNRAARALVDRYWNQRILRNIDDAQDFIGLNHYFHKVIGFGSGNNDQRIVSDVGWELFPASMYEVLVALGGYQKPIYILENGVADACDRLRPWYLGAVLQQVLRAINTAIPVKGYFHWSLLDNFEWEKGFWPRFGLYAVDYRTLQRIARPSAALYAQICHQNALPGQLPPAPSVIDEPARYNQDGGR
ncbi:MAG: family 1 glycosylhydrolase [Candidatus Omnitrophica bacterium]|nr:family 1 glycosylhydrolase [Candidatus Omnitrophota bacterium]